MASVYIVYKDTLARTLFDGVYSTLQGAREYVKNSNAVAKNNNRREFYEYEKVELNVRKGIENDRK